jgi:pimeloyl-ACP methyl ester carboxylesterase
MDHITDRLSEIRAPTLLVGGDRDPSLEAMKVMQRSVAESELVVLSKASHFGNRDQPAAWNSAVMDFLERVERRQRRGLAATTP